MKKDFNKQEKIFIFISALAFFAILILNGLTFKIADDFYYSLQNGIGDIFQKEYIQYMTWGGRSVAHIFARITLSLPSIIFKLLNSLFFIALMWLMYFHATGSKKIDKPRILILILCTTFLFTPVFGQVFLWQTGASNYLWMTTIILWFLLPYRLQLESDQKPSIIAMFLLGILAGWSNENTGGACILLVMLLVAYELFQNKKPIQKWMMSGFIGTCTGFLLMIFAPGNFLRYDVLDENTSGLLYNLTKRINDIFSVFQNEMLIISILCLIFFTLLVIKKKRKEIFITSIYSISSIATVVALIAVPGSMGINTRPIFGAVIFLIIAMAYSINECFKEEEFKNGIHILVSVLLFLSVVRYPQAVMDLLYSNRQNASRDNYVSGQASQGNLNPVVFRLETGFRTVYNPMIFLDDFTNDKTHWLSTTYSEFKGVNGISVTSYHKWNLIYKDGDSSLMAIQEFKKYLETVQSNPEYTVFVASTEIASLDHEVMELLKIEEKDSYIGGIMGELVVQPTEISMDDTTGSLSFTIEGNNISIDGITYTNGNDGISFVVYDQSKNKVVDSVTFDLETKEANRTDRGY